MRNFLSIITVLCMTLSIQANNFVPKNDNGKILVPYLDDDISILTIKQLIADNDRAFYMTGSFTVIKTPTARDGDVAQTVDASFRNNLVLSKSGNDYIQVNAQATRNDNQSNNEFRIYVAHDNRGQGKIDKRNIKVNWKTGSLEVVDKLANVSVLYQPDAILIIGTMQKNGYTVGVSLAISKEVLVK